uniref:Uncharacterized protein n=1 Tax=viral metagenome TaxID=1070528 RepID=A0A6C0DFF8_9ZZZZ
MDAQIEKIVIVFGTVIGLILFGTLSTNRGDTNMEIEKTKTLGRRPKSFLTRKQKTRKSRYHSNKLPTIHENQYENSKGGSKSKTVKRK